MTDNIFAPLLDGAVARGWCHPSNAHKQMDPDLAQAITSEVLAALAAAVPDDLAEAQEMVRRLLNEHDAFSGHAADTITALLARIAAQEAQIAKMDKAMDGTIELLERAKSDIDANKARAESAETALAALSPAAQPGADVAAQAREAAEEAVSTVPDDIELYRIIKRSGARKHSDIARVISERLEPMRRAFAALIGERT